MTKEELTNLGLNDEQVTAIWQSLGKDYVPKTVFNEKNESLKSLSEQLSKLEEKKNLESENQKTKEEYESLIAGIKEEYENKIKSHKLNAALEIALTKSKARNHKAVKALFDEKAFTFNDDGTIAGIDEQLEQLAKTDAYLFESTNLEGVKPNESSSSQKENDLETEINKAFGI